MTHGLVKHTCTSVRSEKMYYKNKGANRSRWEILRDVLESCNGNPGICLTAIIQKANLNTCQAAYFIDVLSKSNLLRVIDRSRENPRQKNKKRMYVRYTKTSKGKAFVDLFDKLQKMVEESANINYNKEPYMGW